MSPDEQKEIEGEYVDMKPDAIVRTEPAELRPVMDLETAQAQLKQFQEYVDSVLVKGEDYGRIPGTPKDAIFKSGVDKLAEIYGLEDYYEEISRTIDWKEGLFDYELKCTLMTRDGRVRGVGMGSCSSFESKYRLRNAERKCPACGAEAIIKQKFGKTGWVCWKKKGGCTAEFAEQDVRIVTQTIGQIKNPDIYDVKNTVLKMAKKRAKSDAVLAATRSSGIFTQADDEDIEDTKPAKPVKQEQQQPQQQEPQPQQPAAEYISEEERRKILAVAGQLHMGMNDIKQYLQETHNTASTTKMTRAIADDVFSWLKSIEQGQQNPPEQAGS